MTFCGVTMTFCGTIMTFCGTIMTFCGENRWSKCLVTHNQEVILKKLL